MTSVIRADDTEEPESLQLSKTKAALETINKSVPVESEAIATKLPKETLAAPEPTQIKSDTQMPKTLKKRKRNKKQYQEPWTWSYNKGKFGP